MASISSRGREQPPPYVAPAPAPTRRSSLFRTSSQRRHSSFVSLSLFSRSSPSGPARSHSPPPAYDAIVPSTSPARTTAGSLSTSNSRNARRSTAASLPRRPAAPPTVEETLGAILDKYPWRRTWGPRPRTLHDALRGAALAGAERLVTQLLDAGAEVRYTTKYSALKATSAVHEALKGPKPGIAMLLVTKVFNEAANAALAGAVEGDDEAVTRAMRMADEKARWLLDARDARGCTPMHIAAGAGETDIVGEMIFRGADVDAADELGRTPMHMAARYGRRETVLFLMTQGADAGLIMEEMWTGESRHDKELGSYGLISTLLAEVAAELNASADIDESFLALAIDDEAGDLSPGELSPQPRSRRRSSQDLPPLIRSTSAAIASRRKSVGFTSNSLHETPPKRYRPGPNAFSLGSRESWMHQPVFSDSAMSVLSASLSTIGKAPPRIRRPPPSKQETAKYAEWKRDCEVLQAEHRRQKERNKRHSMFG
jgi:hypothetical protein